MRSARPTSKPTKARCLEGNSRKDLPIAVGVEVAFSSIAAWELTSNKALMAEIIYSPSALIYSSSLCTAILSFASKGTGCTFIGSLPLPSRSRALLPAIIRGSDRDSSLCAYTSFLIGSCAVWTAADQTKNYLFPLTTSFTHIHKSLTVYLVNSFNKNNSKIMFWVLKYSKHHLF